MLRVRQPFVFVEGQQGLTLADEQIPEQVAAGTIRGLWRSSLGGARGPAPFGWADHPRIFTRSLRHRVTSLFMRAGNSRTDWGEPRPMIRPRARQSIVTRQVGNRPAGPTVRNRLTSFGSRVPPLNQPSPNAEPTE